MNSVIRDSTGYLLVRICRLRRQRAPAQLEEIGLYGGQQWVLRALWQEDGITQTELAERVCVRPSTATRGLRRMEKAGLIERRPDPTDHRVSRVYITGAGRALRGALEGKWREFDQLTFAGFEEEDLSRMREYLQRMVDNLEDGDESTRRS